MELPEGSGVRKPDESEGLDPSILIGEGVTDRIVRSVWHTGTDVHPSEMARIVHWWRRRDTAILTLLLQHRVLQTRQVAVLAFKPTESGRRQAQSWINRYMRHQVVSPFGMGPELGPGKREAQVRLTERGGALLADRLGWSRGPVIAKTKRSYQLVGKFEHDVGLNSFFVAVAGRAARRGDCGLFHWYSTASMRRMYRAMGKRVEPDGMGRLLIGNPQDAGAKATLWLVEWDQGTEPQEDIASKMVAYADAGEDGVVDNVLLITDSPSAEDRRRRAISDGLEKAEHPERLAVYTSNVLTLRQDVLGDAFKPAAGGPRVSLGDLAPVDRSDRELTHCLGYTDIRGHGWWDQRKLAGEGE